MSQLWVMKTVARIFGVDVNMIRAAFRCAIQAYLAWVVLFLPSHRLHVGVVSLDFTVS